MFTINGFTSASWGWLCPHWSWPLLRDRWPLTNWDLTLESDVRVSRGLVSLSPHVSRVRHVGLRGINFAVAHEAEARVWTQMYVPEAPIEYAGAPLRVEIDGGERMLPPPRGRCDGVRASDAEDEARAATPGEVVLSRGCRTWSSLHARASVRASLEAERM